MRKLLLIAVGFLSTCHGFNETDFVQRNCKETDKDIACYSFVLYDEDLKDFANRTFTISNAENVYLQGEVQYLNEYLFEKFPKAITFKLEGPLKNDVYLQKPYRRQSTKKITSKIVDLVLQSISFYGYRQSSTFNCLTSLKSLEISGKNFPEVDEDLLAKNTKLETLIISNTQLVVIAPKALRNLKKLSKVDLSRNSLSIKNLDSNLFSDKSKLTCVDLSSNAIEFVPMGKFWPSSLVSLDLSSNRISTITKNHFKNLKNLASIDLSYNKINVLSRDSFAANTKLIFVSIRSNRVEKIDETLLPNQKKLVHLDVSKNELQDLHNFVGAPGIQHYNASRNRLTSFNEGTYNGTLVTLDFSFNRIKSVAFPTVDSLKIVYLNSNQIPPTEIFRNKFIGVKNLEELHLKGNDMTWIYDDAFDDLENLEIVNY